MPPTQIQVSNLIQQNAHPVKKIWTKVGYPSKRNARNEFTNDVIIG